MERRRGLPRKAPGARSGFFFCTVRFLTRFLCHLEPKLPSHRKVHPVPVDQPVVLQQQVLAHQLGPEDQLVPSARASPIDVSHPFGKVYLHLQLLPQVGH